MQKRRCRPRIPALRGFVRNFHEDLGGQITFLAVIGAVLFVALIGMVVNTGYQASSKVQLQNGVDAATLSAAGWYARGLNLTSGVNVVQTQLVSAGILLNALFKSGVEAEWWARLLKFPYWAGCKISKKLFIALAKTIIGAILAGVMAAYTCGCYIQLSKIAPPVFKALRALRRSLSRIVRYPSGFLWRAVRLLGGFNAGVHRVFNLAFVEAAGWTMSRQNALPRSAQYLAFPGGWFNGEWQAFLPTRRGKIKTLCRVADSGSPGLTELVGYEQGEGPLELGRSRLTWFTQIAAGCAFWPSKFNRDVSFYRREVCSGRRLRFDVWELDDANQKLQLFGVVRSPVDGGLPLLPGFFEPAPATYTWAEVEIYNAIGHDTFTQDWRVRLRPVSLPFKHLRRLQDRLADLIARLKLIDPRVIADLNNH